MNKETLEHGDVPTLQLCLNNSSCYLSEYYRGVAEHAEKAFRKLCDLSVSAVQSIRLLLIHPNVATWVNFPTERMSDDFRRHLEFYSTFTSPDSSFNFRPRRASSTLVLVSRRIPAAGVPQ